jgi:hypothetical protein
MSQWSTYVEASAGTGAFDALEFKDLGDSYAGYYFNHQNQAFLFLFRKHFEAGKAEVDNTVHLPADVLQRLKEENPDLLEKMAHSRPLAYVEGSREQCRFTDGLEPRFVFNLDGDKLPAPVAMDAALFTELKSRAEEFRKEWIWLADGPEAAYFRPLTDEAEWNEFAANLKAHKREAMRLTGGMDDGTIPRYFYGLETEKLSTEDADDYNLLNLLVETRHAAQEIFEKWH